MKTDFTANLFLKCYKNPAYVDEVGLGSIFAELIACAVLIPEPFKMDGVDDSKKLKHENIYKLAPKLKKKVKYALGVVNCSELNEIKNMNKANKLAMKRALSNLPETPDAAFIDGLFIPKGLNYPVHSIVKGDSKVFGIAVASIIAKAERDYIMINTYGEKYAKYHIAKNKGYRSPDHLMAIRKYGITNLHRRWLRDVRKAESGFYDKLFKNKYAKKWKKLNEMLSEN